MNGNTRSSTLDRIDHLVYATPNVDRAVNELERRLGVRASAGGKHPKWGTRNALIALGEHSYLEIIGPDPDQPPPEKSRPFLIDALEASRLVTWAVRATALDEFVSDARRCGVEL